MTQSSNVQKAPFSPQQDGLVIVQNSPNYLEELAELINHVVLKIPFRIPTNYLLEEALHLQYQSEITDGKPQLQIDLPKSDEEMATFLEDQVKNLECQQFTINILDNSPDTELCYQKSYLLTKNDKLSIYLKKVIISENVLIEHSTPWKWAVRIILSGSINEDKAVLSDAPPLTSGNVSIFDNKSSQWIKLLVDDDGNEKPVWILFMHSID